MRVFVRFAFLLSLAIGAGCGGGGIGGADPPRSVQAGWVAALRYEPTNVEASLRNPVMSYMYVDAGASNGAYPAADAFRAQFEAANPGLFSGPCSALARMSGSVMMFTDAHGAQAPSYVVFFQPMSSGTCTQPVNLGAEGVHRFNLTVTP